MFISVVIARAILSELGTRGIDPDVALQVSNLSRTRIMDIREYLTFDELERLIGHAIEATNDPGLGLSVGANAPESMMQLLGHLVLSHSTIREAFASWQRYSVLLTDAVRFQLLQQGELALFTCEPPRQSPCTGFYMELALAVTQRIGVHFVPRSELREVHFCHAEPSYASRYREVFGCPVRFGRKHNALVFPREWLDRTQLHADETMRSFLSDAAERLLSERAQAHTLTARVRSLLEYRQDFAGVDAMMLARRLGMSVRTLRRRLAAEETTLAALLDQARCRVACEVLGRPGASVKEISELLDFSEPSAFHRAFRRWTGRTPTEYARMASAERRTFAPVFSLAAPRPR